MSTTAPELFTSLSAGWTDAIQQWLDQSETMWDQLAAPFLAAQATSAPARRQGHHDHHDHHDHGHHDHEHGHHGHPRHGGHDECDCGCARSAPGKESCGCHDARGRCGCHDACDCCEPDADIVLHTRIGERRVVPFRLHNAWRREREVTLEIGPWHVCSGSDLVVVALLETEKVVLQPCEDRIVRLLVGATVAVDNGDDNGDDQGDGGDTKGKADAKSGTTNDEESGDATHVTPGTNGASRFARDLDGCASAYADVRFEGCARPQRVAVVVSPAECDPADVPCDCGCCC